MDKVRYNVQWKVSMITVSEMGPWIQVVTLELTWL